MDVKTIFDKITTLKVAIIGDVMIDSYIYGKVNRMSPEAPVPVVEVFKKENRLGGAGNVALNIKALGAMPILLSVIGTDEEGKMAQNLMEAEGISAGYILTSAERLTTVKTRVLGNNRQIARVDQEIKTVLSETDNNRLFNTLSNVIKNIDVLILEDYDKGVLNAGNIERILKLADSHGITVAVDPKFNNFNLYKNVSLFKPNLKELLSGLDLKIDGDYAIETILELEEKLKKELGHKISLITLSERGVLIKDKNLHFTAAAHPRNIADVSGAGDTVIAVAACALAAGASLPLIAELSNLAGGLVCEYAGVVPVNKQKLFTEAMKIEI